MPIVTKRRPGRPRKNPLPVAVAEAVIERMPLSPPMPSELAAAIADFEAARARIEHLIGLVRM